MLSDDERAYLTALPEVRVGLARPSFRPYEVIGDDGEISGVHPEMLAGLARVYGLRLRPVVFDSWSAVVKAAQRRDVDMLMSVGVNSERAEFLSFTLGVTPMVTAVFTRRGATGDAARSSYAVVRGNMAAEHLARRYPDARLVETADATAALQAVASGAADGYVGVLLPTLDLLARAPVPGIEVQRLLDIGSGYYHFAVRRDWAPLARILNKGIATMRETAPPQLTAALAALPASVAQPGPRAITNKHTEVLVDQPSWRIGAVRGLSLLNEVDAQGRHSGIAADMADAVARQLGVGLELVPFDSVAQMLDALREDRIDVVPFLTRTPLRTKEFWFSAPYVEMPYLLVARRDAPLYWDLASLRGRRLALAPQHPLREVLQQRHPDITIVDAASGADAMNLVAAGRADAAVEVKLFANLRINADNDGVLRAVATLQELPAQFHFAASQRAKALVPIIDEALAAIAPSERERMLRRWVALDLAPAFPWRRWGPTIAAAGIGLLALIGTKALARCDAAKWN
ncbi:MAG: transporter substrate-binding domain-containing protein, partial [Aquabacterium sp.]